MPAVKAHKMQVLSWREYLQGIYGVNTLSVQPSIYSRRNSNQPNEQLRPSATNIFGVDRSKTEDKSFNLFGESDDAVVFKA